MSVENGGRMTGRDMERTEREREREGGGAGGTSVVDTQEVNPGTNLDHSSRATVF